MSGPIDLHAHSSVSDGTETPAQLVGAAVVAGLDVIAITDHDSTSGWIEAFDAARGTGITVLPGLELSTQLQYASVHVLGYLVDPTNPALVAATAEIREERLHRAETMVSRIVKDYVSRDLFEGIMKDEEDLIDFLETHFFFNDTATTEIYTQVAFDSLRTVAQPWPATGGVL